MKKIGIDFDNTIANYEHSFAIIGRDSGLLSADSQAKHKTEIRTELRAMRDGEFTWQKLQGLVYGKRILEAQLFNGFKEFIKQSRAEGHDLVIVSHKTLLAHHDPDKTNLRDAALGFMQHHGFFDELGFEQGDINFELTREKKVSRIAALGCEIFIDDLEEVFAEPHFPTECRKLYLYPTPCDIPDVEHCPTWQHVSKAVFA